VSHGTDFLQFKIKNRSEIATLKYKKYFLHSMISTAAR